MKKLIQKNPIQRFKEGNKILFAKPGDKFIFNGNEEVVEEILNGQTILRRKNGTYIYPNNRNLTKSNKISNKEVPTTSQSKAFINTNKWIPIPWKEFHSLTSIPQVNIISNLQPKDNQEILSTQLQNKSNSQKTQSNNKDKGISFKQAFNNARNSGLQEFTWRGNKYNTRSKGEENYIFQNGKWVDPQKNTIEISNLSKTPISNLYTPLTESINQKIPNLNLNIPQQIYNRADIRQFIRNKGVNPYSFTGDQRKALRKVMNGQGDDNDKLLVEKMELFKQGGQLISNNPIQRFKMKRDSKYNRMVEIKF